MRDSPFEYLEQK